MDKHGHGHIGFEQFKMLDQEYQRKHDLFNMNQILQVYNKIEHTPNGSANQNHNFKTEHYDDGNCSDDASSLVHQGGKRKLTIEELEQLATKNNPTFSKERNSYGGFTTKSFNTLKINHQTATS